MNHHRKEPNDAITYNDNPAIAVCNLKDGNRIQHSASNPVVCETKQSERSQNAIFDFVGPSNAVKDLFALPFSNDIGVAVAVHNVGNGMLLLDGAVMHDVKDYEHATRFKHRKRRRNRPFHQEGAEQDPVHNLRPISSHSIFKDNALDSNFNSSSSTRATTNNKFTEIAMVSSELQHSSLLSEIDPLIVQRQLALLQMKATTDASDSYIGSSNNGIHHHNISDILPDAEEYTSHITEPLGTQSSSSMYIDWNFKDYNMLVQSNAIILSNEDQGSTGTHPFNQDAKEEIPSTRNALSIRCTQADMLRLALEEHEIKSFRNQVSYAQAVNRNNSKLLDDGKPTLMENEEEKEKKDALSLAPIPFPDFSTISLHSCALPSTELQTKLREYGYSIQEQPPVDLNSNNVSSNIVGPSSSPVCMVLDAYLDNIMANVPQLALCLEEGGLIQGVKILPTSKLPFLRSSDISQPPDSTMGEQTPVFRTHHEPLFSPDMVESNAHMILDFIKTNCAKENQTYLLRRNAGETSVQLLDVTLLSKQRQQKWVHWLAMMSIRFASQLKNLSYAQTDPVLKREYRQKRRNLLENSLQLLYELADIGGIKNEVICSSIYEQLADSYLTEEDDPSAKDGGSSSFAPFQCSFLQPTEFQKSHQPYSNVSSDGLSKAQDLLSMAVKELNKKFDGPRKSKLENEALAIQMYGLYHKQINVGLANTRLHLQRYQSSNVMQSLRHVGRGITSASNLLLRSCGSKHHAHLKKIVLGYDKHNFIQSLSCQYANLWEECGNFARSFASDSLWRDHGHCAGEDICSLLQDVEWSLSTVVHVIDAPESKSLHGGEIHESLSITIKTKGIINLQYLTGIVPVSENIVLMDNISSCLDKTNAYLQKQKLMKKEQRRVLVAACICYGRAADTFMRSSGFKSKSDVLNISEDDLLSLMLKRLGDGCNEVGKVLQEEALKSVKFQENAVITRNILLSSAWWFTEALEAFTLCKDKVGTTNAAVMHCNLASCAKLRASQESFDKIESSIGNKDPMDQAIAHLECAYNLLEQRDLYDPGVWDMVSKELASAYLFVGVRRRDILFKEHTSQIMLQPHITPKIERSIIEPLEKALKIYTAIGDEQKIAATSLHLAQYYSKIWASQRNEHLTKEKLSKAFSFYQKSHQYFFSHTLGNEYALSCLILELSNLYKTVSPEKAILSCIDCQNAISAAAVTHHMTTDDPTNFKKWISQMTDVVVKLEDNILSLLSVLAKNEKRTGNNSGVFQKLYRDALTIKLTTHRDIFDDANRSFRLSFILNTVKDQHERFNKYNK
jgi:hypothetical protein